MRSGYSDVDWFLRATRRATRIVPVIAGAALVGGMIGGFAMFAVDSALTWEPGSQPRPDARADSAASVVDQRSTKPVRIVGGAIPDPSAGMSGPPPAPQRSSAPAQAQVSPQLLTAKPLGPASQLQPQTATTQAATTTQQPQPRWPDALSRAHQNAASATSAQQQAPPPPAAAQTSDRATNETDRKEANSDRADTAATADDQDRAYTSRRGRHSRHQTIFGANGWRNGGNDDSTGAASQRRQDARGYDRLYDSYGNRRERSYGRTREQSYGDAADQSYGDARGDQDNSGYRSDASRSDTRRYGRDTRYRNRSRVITREQPEETDRTQGNQASQGNQALEAGRSRSEPFWGGGFFRRGDGYRDDD
ncbi:MAG TPA: hypothetical protein VFN27_01195 [Xanthobacteraceae bacterium]|nr:hypothetical protein [Xanthobacteraceae bacterium]